MASALFKMRGIMAIGYAFSGLLDLRARWSMGITKSCLAGKKMGRIRPEVASLRIVLRQQLCEREREAKVFVTPQEEREGSFRVVTEKIP